MIVEPQASRRAGPREVGGRETRAREVRERTRCGRRRRKLRAQPRSEPRTDTRRACRPHATVECTRRMLGASGPRAATGHGDVMTDHASRVRAAARPTGTALRAPRPSGTGWVGLSAKPKAVRGSQAPRRIQYNNANQTPCQRERITTAPAT